MVQQTIQIEGVPLHVIDTAGLRDHSEADEVERIGMSRAWDQIALADAVLMMHDLTRQQDPAYIQADAHIVASLTDTLGRHVPVLHLWNKADAGHPQALKPVMEQDLVVSAKTGQGLPALRQKLLNVVGWQAGASDGVFMARERHVQALREVQAHLGHAHDTLQATHPALDVLAEELRLGQNALNRITGEFTSDDLLGVIFSSFCIGK